MQSLIISELSKDKFYLLGLPIDYYIFGPHEAIVDIRDRLKENGIHFILVPDDNPDDNFKVNEFNSKEEAELYLALKE